MDNKTEVAKTFCFKVKMTEEEWKKNGVIELLQEIGDMINELFDDPYRFGTAEIVYETVKESNDGILEEEEEEDEQQTEG